MFPIKTGLVGTGYAAKARAETLQADRRTQLVAVAGHTPESTRSFCQTFATEAMDNWQALIERTDLDLIIISTVNRDHGAIARAALTAGKHVVVEYPLALDVQEAEELIALAKSGEWLLHVEHIELLGGVHQALVQNLPAIGAPFYARYATLNPQNPAPQKWTYQPELFGFPLVGALSRLHRLTDLFGSVTSVYCQSRYWNSPGNASSYTTCICTAQLRFRSGLMAEVSYGKGEALWHPTRIFEVQGERGALVFDGDQGSLIQTGGSQPIEVGGRRGLFAKDTAQVLDYLTEGKPLYVKPEDSLYSLKVADAARRSAETGRTIEL